MTEQTNPGLDIVELMILQGIATQEKLPKAISLHPAYNQERYSVSPTERQHHTIEVRIYCENPSAQFKPSPGVLQHVSFPQEEWLRVDSWVDTGTTVAPYYDPLACKLIVSGATRAEAIERLSSVLSRTKLYGPPNNVQYLKAICDSETFRAGDATTTFLDSFSCW